MGGSQSSLESYIKLHGKQSLFNLILLRKKTKWLQESCVRHINRKIDDEIKYILFQMDQFIYEKKQAALQQYKKTKSEIMLKESFRVMNCEEKHGKSLENIYGKNSVMDRINLLKINFHVQTHLTKKKVKKQIGQKITTIQTQTFLAMTNQSMSKADFEALFQEERQYSGLIYQNPEIEKKLEEFRKQVIEQLNFDQLFWPHFDPQVRQTEQEVTKVYNEVEKNTKSMKKDLQGNWNLFKFQST